MKTVRFHIERRCFRGVTRAEDTWTRETIAGTRTITAARREHAQIRRESPSYFGRDDFRIVKITTTRVVIP